MTTINHRHKASIIVINHRHQSLSSSIIIIIINHCHHRHQVSSIMISKIVVFNKQMYLRLSSNTRLNALLYKLTYDQRHLLDFIFYTFTNIWSCVHLKISPFTDWWLLPICLFPSLRNLKLLRDDLRSQNRLWQDDCGRAQAPLLDCATTFYVISRLIGDWFESLYWLLLGTECLDCLSLFNNYYYLYPC